MVRTVVARAGTSLSIYLSATQETVVAGVARVEGVHVGDVLHSTVESRLVLCVDQEVENGTCSTEGVNTI